MNPGILIAAGAVVVKAITKVPDMFAPRPSRQDKERRKQQAEQHDRENRELAERSRRDRQQHEAHLAEARRKGTLLPPEKAEALHRKGMTYWHGGFFVRQDRAKAMTLICEAARNGHEPARMMARMNGWSC